MLKRLLSLTLALGLVGATASCKINNPKPKNEGSIKNVIFLIGDGMGQEQIRAGELFKQEKLYMQSIQQIATVETNSIYGDVTDSAAAATALATGYRTINGYVGKNDEGKDLETLVDIANSLGKKTGVITTEELYGATPMGFSGHSFARGDYATLMSSAARTSNVNLFASYTIPPTMEYVLEDFVSNGYEIVESPENISESQSEKILGHYRILAGAESMTVDQLVLSLDGLVSEALDYLSKDEDGFFLMVEGAHIDHGGHQNKIDYMLEELLAFDDAVKYVVEWAKKRNDTLVVVTADHETGGLHIADGTQYGELLNFNSETGQFENFIWTTSGHTASYVNCYVYGAEINFGSYSTLGMASVIRNVDIFTFVKDYLTGKVPE